jgi:hypothetical protein
LSSLPLAIGELAVIAALSAIGTVVEQNQVRFLLAQRSLRRCQALSAVRCEQRGR